MNAINSTDHDGVHHRDRDTWPRDFDFREQYAEQQELLKLQGDSTPAPKLPNGENHA